MKKAINIHRVLPTLSFDSVCFHVLMNEMLFCNDYRNNSWKEKLSYTGRLQRKLHFGNYDGKEGQLADQFYIPTYWMLMLEIKSILKPIKQFRIWISQFDLFQINPMLFEVNLNASKQTFQNLRSLLFLIRKQVFIRTNRLITLGSFSKAIAAV